MVEFFADGASRPLHMYDQFHSQFQLQTDKYRDSNNFLMKNRVVTRDDRWLPYIQDEYTFLKIEKGQPWISSSYFRTHNTSYDGGHTYELEETEILFGCYFFLSPKIGEHSRYKFNIMNLMSQLGGIHALMIIIFGSVARFVNT